MGPTRTAKFPSCMVLKVDVPSNATPIKLQNQLRDASGTMNFPWKVCLFVERR